MSAAADDGRLVGGMLLDNFFQLPLAKFRATGKAVAAV